MQEKGTGVEKTGAERRGLILKCRADISGDRIIDYKENCDCMARIRSGMSYEAAVNELLDTNEVLSDRSEIYEKLDRKNLLKSFERGERSFSIMSCINGSNHLPMWISADMTLYMATDTGSIECFVCIYDITDKTLEEQVFSRLPMLGFDVVGILYAATHQCRYFRIKKMRPGALYEHVEDYYASIGEDIENVVLANQRQRTREGLKIETIQKYLEEHETYPFSFSIMSRKGEVLQKLLQFSYLDQSRLTIFFCKSDITAQTKSEHDQIEALEKARLAADNANEAKSVFLSSMSHDLRTPLNGIIGFTELAINESDIGKKQEYLQNIKTSGNLLLALVNDTLELSRIESGKYVIEAAACKGSEIGETVITSVRPMAEKKKIRLTADLDVLNSELLWVDKLKLQKIFLNLISNAIKYTPECGEVNVSATLLVPEADGCSHRIVVKDSGIGMKPEFLPKIFEPFTQERRPEAASVTGTGLGLAIVKKIVTLMGGRISVKSAPGEGSEFTVDLPMRILSADEVEVKARSYDTELEGKCVLLCEDNYLNVEIAKLLLANKGMIVECAADGKRGLEMFTAAENRYDAVLMDVRMPVMSGLEAARQIRALDRADAAAVPIIAMTGDVFEEDIRKCMDAGMNGWVSKPVEPEKLYGTLGRLVTAGK